MKKRLPSEPAAVHRSPRLALETFPGHGIRRLQQIAVSVFTQRAQVCGVTPVQFAVLQVLEQMPGIDQRTLAQEVGFDKATIGGVIDRLEARELLIRTQTPKDRRVRLLTLTEAGKELLQTLMPIALQAQQHMLDPLSPTERQEFIQLMKRMLEHHEGHQHMTASESALILPIEP